MAVPWPRTPDLFGCIHTYIHTRTQTKAGGQSSTTERSAAVCGVIWHDGGAAHGGLLPHVVCNDQFSTMLMSKRKVEAAVTREGRRPEHFWAE